MVSTTGVGGNKPTSKATWNKNKPKSKTQISRFTGAATSDNVLYNKVITSGTNQDEQLIMLVEIRPSFICNNHYADWAESFCGMKRKTATCVFHWQPDALDTEKEYNRDTKIWDRNILAGIKQWRNYVNNGKCIFLPI